MTSKVDVTRRALVPVSSQTRRDAVTNQIRRAILTGEMQPGERLTEVRIASQLGVSRPTLREAIHRLIHEGLLEQEPYKGIRVAQPDPVKIVEVSLVRATLDKLAADLVCEDESGEAQATIDASFAAYVQAHDSGDPLELHLAHIALHRSVWTASKNRALDQMWPTIDAQIHTAFTIDQASRANPARALELHRRLVEALRTRDRETIHNEIEEHVNNSVRELLAILAARQA